LYLLITTRPGERDHKRTGALKDPGPKRGARKRLARWIIKPYRVSLAVKTPDPASKTSAPTASSGTSGIPPVWGNSCDGAAVALTVALADALAEGLADALADEVAVGVAEVLAEALGIILAEALEAGLAIMLWPIPMLL
jgi:hypothetical protein